MLRIWGRTAVWIAAFCLGAVFAQDRPAAPQWDVPRVVAVRVVTEAGAVLEENPASLTLQPGQNYTLDAERASLRELFRKGRYADIRAELAPVAGGVRVDYVVRQNLFISQVHVTSLREPPSEALSVASLRLALGEPFRQTDVNAALDRLRQTLQDEGFYQAQLAVQLAPHPETLQMDVTVNVTPGTRARIGALTVTSTSGLAIADLRSRLKLKPGQEVTSERLDHASTRLRNWLVKQGYLGARVSVRRAAFDPAAQTVPIETVVTSNLKVRVTVEGAKISQGELRKLLPIYEEGAVDEDLLQEGRRAIRDYLGAEGYFDATVDYTVGQASEGAAVAQQITYTIDRGQRKRLVGLAFDGNRYFSDALLRGRLRIEPANFATRGRLSRQLLDQDAASIQALYEANGFLGARASGEIHEDYRGKSGDLFVEFHIQEGQQTRVAELRVEGNRGLSSQELLSVIGTSAGQPYSEFNVAGDRDNILALYYDQGFPEARFTSLAEPVPPSKPGESPGVKLTYTITEGTQLEVARVLVSGFERTRPGIIQRQIAIKAGQPLSEGAVVETQRNLYNLGIFSRVAIAPQNPAGDDPDKTMVVLVDEARRYTLAYGLGFEAQRVGSATSGPTGTALRFSPRATFEITKENLTGRADTLSFKIRASTLQGRGLLSYTSPNTFGRSDFNFQVNLYADKTRDIQTFTSTRYEGSTQLSEKLSSASSLIYRYFYRRVLASDLQVEPEEIPLFSQPTQVSGFGVTWLRDRRDNPADASRGQFDNVDLSIASKSLDSSASFIRLFMQNSTYSPIGRYLVFARSTVFGIETPYSTTISNEIPLPERFFAGGGASLRGFGLNQAGPRDPLTGFPVGGLALLQFNQDLRFPMRLPWIGNRLGGGIFYDAGNVFTRFGNITLRTAPPAPVFDPAHPGTCLSNCTNDLNYFSHTVGFEFRYHTPVGPVSVDLAYQLNPARFLLPATAGAGLMLSRLPAFQFFVNLGGSY
ncbi:MAG: POTRA domain-containing protein [Candidatus Acidiferrales bacterium]